MSLLQSDLYFPNALYVVIMGTIHFTDRCTYIVHSMFVDRLN